MRMQKRKFRIGELAEHLAVEKFVIRFWEKEFGVTTTRSDGGQRFYDEKDLATFTLIKRLLYEQGFTIAGARKYLKEAASPKNAKNVIASRKTSLDEQQLQQLVALKQQLLKLSELL